MGRRKGTLNSVVEDGCTLSKISSSAVHMWKSYGDGGGLDVASGGVDGEGQADGIRCCSGGGPDGAGGGKGNIRYGTSYCDHRVNWAVTGRSDDGHRSDGDTGGKGGRREIRE